ncbi:MAG TPA: D-alanyl-D-alanine carboxypeptidase [Ruminococcaceae bacterium]|nr:D-alanyl-D-alanine carboxypeptidase [Oscillospiraceae bacterium]
MRKLKIFTIIFTLFLQISLLSTSLTAFAAFSPSFVIHSEGVYMVNLDTGIEIVSKNADKRLVPASTAKIMTALVTLERVKNLEDKVQCPYECFNEFWEGNPNFYGASDAAIEPRQDNLTYKDCLYALMLASACEGANVLAYNVGQGSIPNFVAMMNQTAEKIGCKNTHFTNPHGLYEEEQYTTAYDLYLITKYALDNYPMFGKICSTYEYEMPANEYNPDGYTKVSTNQLLSTSSEYYCEGVKGVKTGSIDYYYHKKNGEWDTENGEKGSRALVSIAERGGYSYIIVTLGAPFYDENGETTSWNFADHYNLYEWAFSEFEYSQVIGKNEQIMQVEVLKGQDADSVGVVTTKDYFTLMPKSLDKSSIQRVKPTLEAMTAPISAGTVVGELELRLNGETLTKIPLAVETDINLDFGAELQEKLMTIVTSPWFIAGVSVFFALLIALIVMINIEKKKRKRARERRNIHMAPRYNDKNNRKR